MWWKPFEKPAGCRRHVCRYRDRRQRVKLSVIEVKLSKDREYDYTLISDTSINTDAAALSSRVKRNPGSHYTLWNILSRRYSIPSKKFTYRDQQRCKTGTGQIRQSGLFHPGHPSCQSRSRDRIAYITPEQESQLSVLGIVPQKRRLQPRNST